MDKRVDKQIRLRRSLTSRCARPSIKRWSPWGLWKPSFSTRPLSEQPQECIQAATCIKKTPANKYFKLLLVYRRLRGGKRRNRCFENETFTRFFFSVANCISAFCTCILFLPTNVCKILESSQFTSFSISVRVILTSSQQSLSGPQSLPDGQSATVCL